MAIARPCATRNRESRLSKIHYGILALAIAAAPVAARAGDLSPQAASEVVDQLIKGLDSYVDPAVAAKVQARLREQKADYVRLETRAAFAKAVSADLYDVSRDGHLKVSLETVQADKAARLTEEQMRLIDQRLAYGFMGARRLPGNIGYMKLRNFEQSEDGAALMDTVLGLLRHTDALIIDLRENTGGGGESDTELLGQLSREAIPMVKITWRNADGSSLVEQRRVRHPVGGPIYPDKPVYVLTAKRTFSAAEEFAYDLKASGRAVLVGETTGGGANPSNRPVPLSYGFRVFIPNGHVEHPLTHANWEGVGVAPDVAVPPETALTEAYRRALEAARPAVSTPRSEAERKAAMADPRAALLADQPL